ncbi:uncharacterized protein BX663DRAFT_554968 [Cokeromyces recurvatus]|uniref:uncharacterized protein n=1 Tax=Cokeromyces recurvatus TaxID=90255 RepID=UPI00221FD89D|nr:uncharacterized protein BX663DRAFT_554968 [Cokeromyces recurvatus]KAI7899328.1 hypothetical protein BX663DRAFT_554968 [Cokeromyces recurvatus]
MKLTALLACLLAVITISCVQASSMDDALKKFCGGLELPEPKKGHTFSNPKKIKITVKRKPNSEQKVISAVDAYSINSKGQAQYLRTVWKGSYKLHKKASLTVNLEKAQVKFPGQFEFRVWVHNERGPDCTLMSKVFKVKSSSHNNAAEEAEYQQLNENIDRGCFGVELVSPGLGGEVIAGQPFNVHINRDSAAHTDTVTKLELYRVNLDSRESTKIQDSWSGSEMITNLMSIKNTIPTSAKVPNSAFYYKLSGTTQHGESCDFFSHPFYVN